VRGGSLAFLYGSMLAIGLLTVPMLLTDWEHRQWPHPAVVLAAIVFIGLGAIGLALYPPRFGRPVLRLSGTGLWAPSFGVIPWESVRGISLFEVRARGSVTFRFLCLSVPDLARFAEKFGPLNRLRYRLQRLVMRGVPQVRILLRHTSEAPEVIVDLAKALWRKRTGRSYDWDARFSDEENAALQGLSTGWEQITALSRSSATPASALTDKLAEQEHHFGVLARAGERRARTLRRVLWFFTAAVVLYLLVSIARFFV